MARVMELINQIKKGVENMERIIVRQTNQYNKGYKWNLLELTTAGGKVSSWYKTRKEAEYAKTRSENIGNKYTTDNRTHNTNN